MRPVLSVLLAMVTSGCAQLLGIDDTQLTEPDAAVVDAAPAPDAGLACADRNASGEGTIDVDTDPATDDWTLTCGGAGAGDVAIAWTAPVTDYYVFDTFGSSFDTIIGLVADCEGTELACGDNAGASAQSEVTRKVAQGETVLVVVDGAAGDRGPGVVNVSRVGCPDADLEGQTFPLDLTTAGFGDDAAGACGGGGHADRAYHWVAPTDGLYAFSVTAEGFSPAIELFEGARCDGRVLGCGGAVFGPYGAEVVRRLGAGEIVGFTVDGVDGEGAFQIDVRETGATCPADTLVNFTTRVIPEMTSRTLAPGCVPVRVSSPVGTEVELLDYPFQLEVPAASEGCFGDCRITATATGPIALYALERGDCGGAELACEAIPVGSMQDQVSIELEMGDTPQLRTVVVADAFSNDGTGIGFEIVAECFEACP